MITPILIGQNPSRACQFRKNSTVSWLTRWIEGWGYEAMAFTNIHPDPDWDKRTMSGEDYAFLRDSIADHYPVIALGAIAEKHLRKLGYEPLRMPHPSGANLQMNHGGWKPYHDKVKEQLNGSKT